MLMFLGTEVLLGCTVTAVSQSGDQVDYMRNLLDSLEDQGSRDTEGQAPAFRAHAPGNRLQQFQNGFVSTVSISF